MRLQHNKVWILWANLAISNIFKKDKNIKTKVLSVDSNNFFMVKSEEKAYYIMRKPFKIIRVSETGFKI